MIKRRCVHLMAATGEIRVAEYQHKEHLVVPVVALVEGVMWPSNSPTPELVLAEEYSKFPQGWNGRFCFYGHPEDDGQPVSANSPKVLEARSFGSVFNSRIVNKKLHVEAWIDPDRATEVGAQELVDRIRSGEMVEISVGAFVMAEEVSGEYGGKHYDAVWREIVPDHLALLPVGDTGACSNAMGCGAPRRAKLHVLSATGTYELQKETPMSVPKGKEKDKPKTLRERFGRLLGLLSRSEMSDVEVRHELTDALLAKEPGMAWIEAVYETTVVYCILDPVTYDSSYYQRDYTIDDTGKAIVADTRIEVEPVLYFEPVAAKTKALQDKLQAAKGARHSKADQAKIQTVHDEAVSLGASCAEPTTASSKPCGCGVGTTTASSTPAEGEEEMKTLIERVKALRANPKLELAAVKEEELVKAGDAVVNLLEKHAEALAKEETEAAARATAEKEAAAKPKAAAAQTEEEELAAMSPSLREIVVRAKAADKARRDAVVAVLVSKQKVLSKEALEKKSSNELEEIAQMLGATVPPAGVEYGISWPRENADQRPGAEGNDDVPKPPSIHDAIRTNRGQKTTTTVQ